MDAKSLVLLWFLIPLLVYFVEGQSKRPRQMNAVDDETLILHPCGAVQGELPHGG